MALINFLESFKNIKNRNILRKKNKINIKIAKKFGKDYFDGSRNSGYGGYYYDGRWVKVAKKLIKYYKLKKNSRILDIGCAKGFLVKDLLDLGMDAYGIDVSKYAILNAVINHKEKRLFLQSADKIYFPDNFFDLVVSFNTIHNLDKDKCIKSIKEIVRVSNNNKSFIQVDAYENLQEKNNFMKWMLTAKTYGKPKFWLNIFKKCDYKGDWFWTKV